MGIYGGAWLALATTLSVAVIGFGLAWRRGTRARDLKRDKMAAQRAQFLRQASAQAEPPIVTRRSQQNFGRR